MSNKFSRVYHPWDQWEEIQFNMWGSVDDKSSMIKKAVLFIGNHKKYGSYMNKVVIEWPISCENALTDYSINRKAWIGQAAAAMAIGCPEDITRTAWGQISNEQQLLANKEARRAIRKWENSYRKSLGIREDMGIQMLLWRDS